jgi:predicted O-methyltransferase YrrM
MVTKDKLYIMRDDNYTQGLISMIDYINEITPTKDMSMIEIGSYAGESTQIFANRFKEVVSIDPYLNDYDVNDVTCQYMDLNEVYEKFKIVIDSNNNIKHIKATSNDAIINFKEKTFDFVYIDGLHTYEQMSMDIKNYLPLIKSTGFIGGHDYHEVYRGVINAINENFTIDKLFSDTSWIFKINK